MGAGAKRERGVTTWAHPRAASRRAYHATKSHSRDDGACASSVRITARSRMPLQPTDRSSTVDTAAERSAASVSDQRVFMDHRALEGTRGYCSTQGTAAYGRRIAQHMHRGLGVGVPARIALALPYRVVQRALPADERDRRADDDHDEPDRREQQHPKEPAPHSRSTVPGALQHRAWADSECSLVPTGRRPCAPRAAKPSHAPACVPRAARERAPVCACSCGRSAGADGHCVVHACAHVRACARRAFASSAK